MVLLRYLIARNKCRGVSLKQHPMVADKTINVYKIPALGRFGVFLWDAKIESWK